MNVKQIIMTYLEYKVNSLYKYNIYNSERRKEKEDVQYILEKLFQRKN